MITTQNFKQVLKSLDFESKVKHIFTKRIQSYEFSVDFKAQKLIYPQNTSKNNPNGIIINDETTCNFSKPENFVVFECVIRLIQKGYKAEHLELEPKWKLGRDPKSGKADILVKDMQNNPYLLIECKTSANSNNAKSEFSKEWERMQKNGGQLFSYFQQQQDTQYLCLYTSDFIDSTLSYENYIIAMIDNKEELEKLKKDDKLKNGYAQRGDEKYTYKVWQKVYAGENWTNGIFENEVPAYQIKKIKPTIQNLKSINPIEIKKQQYAWATILRANAIGERAHAIKILMNLLLCKITDEINNPNDLRFSWSGYSSDSAFDLVDRLQELYQKGMKEQLGEDIIYYSKKDIDIAFTHFRKNTPAQKSINNIFNELKYLSNGDFNFLEVNNLTRFNKNFKVLLSVVQSLENLKLDDKKNAQMLGDFFEIVIKDSPQTEGQYFTPTPLVNFIIYSLPILRQSKVLDFSCGAGHFLSEFVRINGESNTQLRAIDKDERLAKITSISALMHGAKDIQTTYSIDSLSVESDDLKRPALKENYFNCLISNPPYAVDNFLDTLDDETKQSYEIYQATQNDNSNAIECYFIEKSSKVLDSNGLLSLVLPSSLLNKTDTTYTTTRQILFRDFKIVAICEFGNQTFWKTGTQPIILFAIRKDKSEINTTNNKIFKHFYDSLKQISPTLSPAPQENTQNLAQAPQENIQNLSPAPQDLNQESQDSKQTRDDMPTQENTLDSLSDEYPIFATLLESYASFRGFTLQEAREIFTLALSPDSAIFKLESFKEYKKAYEIILTKSKKKPSLNEFIREIESEKFLYFCYCYDSTPLIIKAPQDNQTQKKFLGYFWSNTKGNEGIHYLTINDTKATDGLEWIDTPLFNPKNRFDTSKLSFLVLNSFLEHFKQTKQNLESLDESFLCELSLLDSSPSAQNDNGRHVERSETSRSEGSRHPYTLQSIPKDLEKYAFRANLLDLIDFSKVDFNKAISLNPARHPERSEGSLWQGCKYELVKLGTLIFENPKSKIQVKEAKDNTSGIYPFYTSGQNIYKYDTPIVSGKNIYLSTGGNALVQFYDGESAYSTDTYVIKSSNEKEILTAFLYVILKSQENYINLFLFKGMGLKHLQKTEFKNLQIPLPPLEIQKQIVRECEEVEKQYQSIRMSIEEYQNLIKAILQKCGIIASNAGGGQNLSLESILSTLATLLQTLQSSQISLDSSISKTTQENLDSIHFKSEALTTLQNLIQSLPTPPKEGWERVRLNNGQFSLQIGKRVLNKELNPQAKIPVFSANVREPFGYIDKELLKDYENDSVLWGIDGDWMTSFVPKNTPFYPTDHCGVLRNIDGQHKAKLLQFALESSGIQAGFSRNLRASIERVEELYLALPPLKEQEKITNTINFIESNISILQENLKGLESKNKEILEKYLF